MFILLELSPHGLMQTVQNKMDMFMNIDDMPHVTMDTHEL